MAWPTPSFGSLTGTQNLSLFDAMFAQVAAMVPIPCTVGGSANAITLQPAGTAPTLSSYATGNIFNFKATANSTAAVTIQFMALAALPLYHADGTTQVTNQLVNGRNYTVVFDQTLNAGSGGFFLPMPQLPGTTGQVLTMGASGGPAYAPPPTAPPGGASGTVQYNNSGAFGGIANVTSNGTNLTGVRLSSTASLNWDSGASAVDLSVFRDGADILAYRRGTNPQTVRVYNTFTDASNYERGAVGWTSNIFTIAAAAAGTGTGRNVEVIMNGIASGGGNSIEYWSSPGAGVKFAGAAVGISPFGGVGQRISLSAGCCLSWMSSSNVESGGPPDIGMSRSASKVVRFSDGDAANSNGWIQWGGQARVTADFPITSSTVLTNVTGLSVNVQAGRTYSFEAELSWTDAAAGGVQAAIAGTCTATNIIYDGWIIDSGANGIKGNAQATALATAVASAVTTGTAGHITIQGTITVNAAGTLTVQFAQNTSNGTASTVKRGSRFIVHDMP